MTPATRDYSSVTEAPGTLVSPDAMDMVLTRYAFTAQHCGGKAVLEVACGPGVGLGYLSTYARRLVAGDYTASLLWQARAHYGTRVPLVRLDATRLPFRDASFDVILLFEAIYFLPSVDAFLESCRRVLARDGRLLVVTVNPAWEAFNPSPFATKYWTAGELDRVLRAHRFSADLYGGFPVRDPGVRGRIVSVLKRAAVKLHLIPKTMKGKERLKRLAFGRLSRFPEEVTRATGTYREPVRLTDPGAAADYQVLYVAARKEEP